jgi:hypothetical protein
LNLTEGGNKGFGIMGLEKEKEFWPEYLRCGQVKAIKISYLSLLEKN